MEDGLQYGLRTGELSGLLSLPGERLGLLSELQARLLAEPRDVERLRPAAEPPDRERTGLHTNGKKGRERKKKGKKNLIM